MNINTTLIGQSVASFIFVLFCMKFVWPPAIAALQKYQKEIADDLDVANRAAHGLELAHEKADQQPREAKAQAAEIVEQAKECANQIVDEARDQAHTEGERLKIQAQMETEQELNSVKDTLHTQVGVLAIIGAEKIPGAPIDANAHEQLVSKLTVKI